MIWLCCHTGPDHLRRETLGALAYLTRTGDEVVVRNVGASEFAYGAALLEFWDCDQDLAIVEPDIVIRPDVVREFHECGHGYCSYPYAITTDVMPALGCTRFGIGFRRKHADAMTRALAEPGGYGAGHYRSVDVGLQRYVLARNGVQPHVHLPPVTHLNEKQVLIAGADPAPRMEVPLW